MAAQMKPESTALVARPLQAVQPINETHQKVLERLDRGQAALLPFLRGTPEMQRDQLLQVAGAVYLAVANNPDLLRCTPESLVHATAKSLARGLEIGETVHLVPVKKKVKVPQPDGRVTEQYQDVCDAWNDYRGNIQLAIRSGALRDIEAYPVYQHERFVYRKGTNALLEHEPVLDPAARGAMIGAYAILYLPFGRTRAHFVDLAKIESIRAKSKSWGPERVKTCPDWYAVKTAVNQSLKLLPKTEKTRELFRAMETDERAEFGDAEVVARAVALPAEPAPGVAVEADEDEAEYTVERGTPAAASQSGAGDTGEVVGVDSSPADAAAPVAPSYGSLAWAQSVTLPFKKSPQFGQRLADFSIDHLKSLERWCEQKIADAQDAGTQPSASLLTTYEAASTLIEHAERAQTALALDEEAGPALEPEGPPEPAVALASPHPDMVGEMIQEAKAAAQPKPRKGAPVAASFTSPNASDDFDV